jgi:ABC-type multidrug transport system fused ATPase/permease subunit
MLLRQTSLVLLDEASAACDPKTAALMREVLKRHVEGTAAAVVQIAHDLEAIVGYDRVVVMAGGRVVEEGRPGELAEDRGTHFGQMFARTH